ncbi:hypothetical protein I302_103326 [Kwoniella bestiolae CBS 10118]|uniref:Uncharacterized protein n=1 Tax=Kwoniella bestiolae CBS 10118 TaxID=1296100 RepID=A0A1B9G872_9TREE|nr:hypothetical protein I302_02029 [Kwoniella bestiolae CBS 10118]OCF27191.1 hypothetical protein I302_02029 [Kwoniella bestiolae CBS 10118]
MESSGSPILTPLSPSSLTSPPPLSSAGLSSRITSSINTVHPRFSTLLPNSSGYLAFFSRPRQQPAKQHRSTSFPSYFRSLPGRLNRSISSIRRGESKKPDSPPRPHQHLKKEEGDEKHREEGEWKEVEDDWKFQAKGLKEGYMQCLNGAKCITITDPIGDLTDEYLHSTVIISSSQDPFPHLPNLAHRSPRRRSSSLPELRHSTSPTVSSKPNLSPIPPSPLVEPTSYKLTRDVDDNGVNEKKGRGQTEDEREEASGDNARILDVRAGTASSSTRRVPTQKSVHPTLGHKSIELNDMARRHSIIDIEGEEDDADEEIATPRQIEEAVLEPLIFPVPMIKKTLLISPNQTFEVDDTSTPKTDKSYSSSHSPSHIIRPSAPAPPLTTPSRANSLVLNPDEYEYLLSLHANGMRNAGQTLERSRSTSSSSTARPHVRPNDTLNNDTPPYSPELTTLPIQLTTSPDNLTYLPPSSNISQPIMMQAGGRDVYREHLRRAVVQHYNDSPTPTPTPYTSQSERHMLVVPRRGGGGKGLRRALGRGLWHKRNRNNGN